MSCARRVSLSLCLFPNRYGIVACLLHHRHNFINAMTGLAAFPFLNDHRKMFLQFNMLSC